MNKEKQYIWIVCEECGAHHAFSSRHLAEEWMRAQGLKCGSEGDDWAVWNVNRDAPAENQRHWEYSVFYLDRKELNPSHE